MNRAITALTLGAALAASLALAPASAQNRPPPGNVNPGSLNSGAEQSGASNQPRSYSGNMGPRAYYGGGYDAYAAPYGSIGYRSGPAWSDGGHYGGPGVGLSIGAGAGGVGVYGY